MIPDSEKSEPERRENYIELIWSQYMNMVNTMKNMQQTMSKQTQPEGTKAWYTYNLLLLYFLSNRSRYNGIEIVQRKSIDQIAIDALQMLEDSGQNARVALCSLRELHIL